MNKKALALMLGALTATALTAPAQTTSAPAPAPAAAPAPAPAAPAGPSVTLTPAVVGQYMFRGQRLDGPSFEPTIEIDDGAWGLGIWMNFPITDKVPGQSDPEIDPYGFYTITVNDATSIVPGFTLYTYPRANTSNGFYKTTFEPNIALNYTAGGVKFTPKIYYDVVLKGPTYELTLAYTVPLKDAGTELDFTAQGGYYTLSDAIKGSSPDTKAYGNYWLAGVSLPFQVTKDSKLTLGIAYTKGGDAFFKQSGSPKAVNTGAVGRGVASISYSYTF